MIDYGDICKFIRDTCLFTSMDMGYIVLVTPPPSYTSLTGPGSVQKITNRVATKARLRTEGNVNSFIIEKS